MNDKLSRYNIEVEHDSCILLFNGLTNKLLSISFEDYAVIETLLENLDEFQRIYPYIYDKFKNAGFITEKEFDELSFIKFQNKKKVFIDRDYHLTINPTLDCNLKCWYCSVDYAGAKHTKERMSGDTIEGIKKHIIHLIDKKADSIKLDWFGGEPLMYYEEVIKNISQYLLPIMMDANISFNQQITTNATYLNKNRIIEMRDLKFNFFQITLDGNRERHNKIKFYSNKKGTYSDIIDNINLIAEYIPDAVIYLRVNYDKQTLKDITDIINDLSIKSKEIITIDFQRVWQVDISEKEKKLLIEANEKFTEAGIKSNPGPYYPMRFKHCYADSFSHYVINYDGRVFKCTARDYSDRICLGHLGQSGEIEWNDSLVGKYFEKATFENEICENCKFLPFCMGPCIQKNFESRIENKPLESV